MPISLDQLRSAPGSSYDPAAAGPIKFSDVPYGPQLHRIAYTPRREVPGDTEENRRLAAWLTEKLALSANPEPGPLLVLQAIALKEAWENKGGIGVMPVGSGKTLTSFLLPEVWQAPRPLILTQAKMVKPAETQRALLSRHWRMRPASRCPVLSYELLCHPSSGEKKDKSGKLLRKSKLELLEPTHLILDECHSAANSGGVAARRIARYLKAHPDTVVWAMTGTLFKKSIKDAAHIMHWALGERSPLPYDFQEREMWASALDARAPMQGGVRAGAGALVQFLSDSERLRFDDLDDDEKTALLRQAIARRILETPGVVSTQSPPVSIGLEIKAWAPEKDCDHTEDLFRTLRGVGSRGSPEREQWPGWRLPDGTEIADGIAMARQAANAGLGFYQVWRPEPPPEWRFARNSWSRWCRKTIQRNRIGLDSEAPVKDAVRRGLLDDTWLLEELPQHLAHLAGSSRLENWDKADAAERARTGHREPPSVSVWVSWQMVEECHRWLKSVGCGLIWTRGIGTGELLEKHLGIPYYRAGGVDAAGRHITRHEGGSAVASIQAVGTGMNIQHLWCNNLWLGAPSEQSLGRTHRPGQKADVVRNWIYLGCPEHLKAFESARSTKAKFAEQMTASPQKLCFATTDMPEDLSHRNGRRWQLGAVRD